MGGRGEIGAISVLRVELCSLIMLADMNDCLQICIGTAAAGRASTLGCKKWSSATAEFKILVKKKNPTSNSRNLQVLLEGTT